MKYYAHSLKDKPKGEWQTLKNGVDRSRDFLSRVDIDSKRNYLKVKEAQKKIK